MKPFGEKNLDVLQSIESAIIEVFRADPKLLDLDVSDALNPLIRQYRAEEEQRRVSRPDLHERAERVFEAVKRVCEWHLGRVPLSGRAEPGDPKPIATSELLVSLRQIQKSVPLWSKLGGRQGYLHFVSKYVS